MNKRPGQRTEKQLRACKRNFRIFKLRGIYKFLSEISDEGFVSESAMLIVSVREAMLEIDKIIKCLGGESELSRRRSQRRCPNPTVPTPSQTAETS